MMAIDFDDGTEVDFSLQDRDMPTLDFYGTYIEDEHVTIRGVDNIEKLYNFLAQVLWEIR